MQLSSQLWRTLYEITLRILSNHNSVLLHSDMYCIMDNLHPAFYAAACCSAYKFHYYVSGYIFLKYQFCFAFYTYLIDVCFP